MATPPKKEKKKTTVVYDGSARAKSEPDFSEVDIIEGKVQQGNFTYQSNETSEVVFADGSRATVFAGQLVEVVNMRPQRILEYVTDDDE